MSSEDEDRSSEEKPGSNSNAGEHRKRSAFSYTREILLSVAQLDRCKKLPAGFKVSILREIHDHSSCSPELSQSSGTHSFQNNQLGILLQTPEDGILGSGSFRRVPVCRTVVSPPLKDDVFHLLSRSAEPYRPPSLAQRRWIGNDDQYNNETFGLSKDLSEGRTKSENQRRDSFLLMREKKQMTIQGNQDIYYEGLLKRNLKGNFDTCLKPENEEMLVEKYGRSEEPEMVVASANLSEVCKVMQTKASEFLPPECIPDVSSRLISSNFTWAFIDEEKHLPHDQEGVHNSKQSSSGVDQLTCPKQASDSDNDSLEALLCEIQLCCINKCLPTTSTSSNTDSTEDLRSPFSENNSASLDLVPMPQNLLDVDVEEPLSQNVDGDDAKPDDSSRGRTRDFLDKPTSQSILNLQTESETKVEKCDFGGISFPEEDELICFDDYCVCLPEEEALISFDDYQLVPQEGEYSSPVATKDTSSSSDNSAEQVALGAWLTNKRYYHSDTESPNNVHNCSDPASWRTPSDNMNGQDYNCSSTLQPQLSTVIPCSSHQSPQESSKSLKVMSRFAKAYGNCTKFPHHLPTLLLPNLFQNPEPAANTSEYSVNYLLRQQVPFPRAVPGYQKYSPFRDGGISPCAQKQTALSYPGFPDRQQLPYHDLAFRIPDHAWECW